MGLRQFKNGVVDCHSGFAVLRKYEVQIEPMASLARSSGRSNPTAKSGSCSFSSDSEATVAVRERERSLFLVGRPGLDPGTLGLKEDAFGQIRPVVSESSENQRKSVRWCRIGNGMKCAIFERTVPLRTA